MDSTNIDIGYFKMEIEKSFEENLRGRAGQNGATRQDALEGVEDLISDFVLIVSRRLNLLFGDEG